jgi:hypothetical protein
MRGRTQAFANQGAGYITKAGYRRIKRGGRWWLEHRWLWEQANGSVPSGYCLHHRNHDKADNRLENLELKPWGQHTTDHAPTKPVRRGWYHSEDTKRRIGETGRATKNAQRMAS